MLLFNIIVAGDSMDLEKIRKAVCGDVYYFDSVGSTNTEALKCDSAADFSLFLAKNQTGGRGRMGRSWESSKGGIYMTVLIKPDRISENIPALTLMAGLGVARIIQNSRIKWPNDIVLGNKKVAGILAESKIIGKSGVIAVGIGINANNTDFCGDLAEKATSIYLFSGEQQDETGLVTGVYKELLQLYKDFDKGFSRFSHEYREKCVTLNREITVIKDGREYTMTAKDIGDNGELIAEANGKTERIAFGEVSVRGLLGYL